MPSQLPAQTCRQRFVPHWSHWVCSVNRFLSQGKKQNARIVLRRQSLDCLWVYGGFTPILHFQICMATCPCLLESEYENAEKQATKAATPSIFFCMEIPLRRHTSTCLLTVHQFHQIQTICADYANFEIK